MFYNLPCVTGLFSSIGGIFSFILAIISYKDRKINQENHSLEMKQLQKRHDIEIEKLNESKRYHELPFLELTNIEFCSQTDNQINFNLIFRNKGSNSAQNILPALNGNIQTPNRKKQSKLIRSDISQKQVIMVNEEYISNWTIENYDKDGCLANISLNFNDISMRKYTQTYTICFNKGYHSFQVKESSYPKLISS